MQVITCGCFVERNLDRYAYALPLLTWLTFQTNRSHLRLVYEGNPMGWVVEQAGGRASTGTGAMLDQQVGVCCGLFDYT